MCLDSLMKMQNLVPVAVAGVLVSAPVMAAIDVSTETAAFTRLLRFVAFVALSADAAITADVPLQLIRRIEPVRLHVSLPLGVDERVAGGEPAILTGHAQQVRFVGVGQCLDALLRPFRQIEAFFHLPLALSFSIVSSSALSNDSPPSRTLSGRTTHCH